MGLSPTPGSGTAVCVLQVFGDKDTDGFYRGELRGRTGLIPCNMVSEIRAEDEETLQQLIRQGFLPLSTPVDRIGTAGVTPGGVDGQMEGWMEGQRGDGDAVCAVARVAVTLRSDWSSPEQKRRGGRRDQTSRRMVALYDYDPRESSPNTDVEAELTFCAGDIIAVFGDIDEDGFYYVSDAGSTAVAKDEGKAKTC